MKYSVAVACCGLGHIYRGIEVWARETAYDLHSRGLDVTLFKGGGKSEAPFEVVVPCIQRARWTARWLTTRKIPGLWRWGLDTPYSLESCTFTRRLIPLLRDQYDIVHLQDPSVARLLLQAKRRNQIR